MRGTLEVALKANLHPRHQHCTDEAQKAETILSAGSIANIYIYICYIPRLSLSKTSIVIG